MVKNYRKDVDPAKYPNGDFVLNFHVKVYLLFSLNIINHS